MREDLIRTGPSGTGLILAFAAGAAIGTIAALLLAPAPGVETRRRVRDAAREAARRPKEIIERLPDVGEEPIPEEFAEARAEAH